MQKLKIIKIVKFGLMPALIFFIVFLSHNYSPIVTSWDSTFAPLVAISIINRGDTNLDEYESILKNEPNMKYSYEYINGHYYWLFPIGTPLLSVPICFIYKQITSVLFTKSAYIDNHSFQLFAASFIVALTALFIYLIAHFSTGNTAISLLIVAIFAFCTSAWSVASRALWQHGPTMLMLSLALFLILLAKKKPWLIKFVGLPLAFSYVVRPTNMMPIVLLTFFVFLEYRRYFFSYLLWALLIFVPFISYNLSIYNSFLSSYYTPFRGAPNYFGVCHYFWVALVGHLFSPSRGIFIFSPILLLSVYGMFLKLTARKIERLDLFLILIIFMHWITISCYSHWTGDFSVGNRVFSDMMPYFVFFLIPVITRISQMKRLKQLVAIFIFFGLMAVSFMIHYRCVTELGPARWNNKIFDNKWNINSKVWDWQDIQFLN